MTIRVHVVPHTHWDREWYHGAARSRLKLARLIDDLAELLHSRPDFPTFLLDGQSIILDDYLAVRPDGAGTLRALLAEGRVEVGPWYVLPDELLVSAEALVRDLIEGGAAVRRHGGTALRVGYSPDAFGHSGALPLILRGFGIDAAVAWRGFGGEPGQDGDLHRWRSVEGSEVLLIHLPPPGYEYGSNLPSDRTALVQRWTRLRAMLESRARSPHWLVLAGADHHAAQPDLPEVAGSIAALEPGCDTRMASLGGYADAVRKWAAGHAGELPVVVGELRAGHRHAWALQGTHGSRLYLKQANAACQRLLERYAEPLCALAALRGRRDRRAELAAAWRTLLENHAHDSICGTSADGVHREMVTRYARCLEQADEIMGEALLEVVSHDPVAARDSGRIAWKPAVLLFNPTPVTRSAVVEAEVAVFRSDVPVGQGSRVRRAARSKYAEVVLTDQRGNRLPVQELDRRVGYELTESPRHYPDCDEVEWHRVAVWATDLPPLGVAAMSVRGGGTGGRWTEGTRGPEDEVIVEGGEMRNARLWVRVDADGSFAALDRATGESYHGLGALECDGDVGDSYTYSAPRGDRVVEVPDEVAVTVVHAGPLRGTLEVLRRYPEIDLEARMRITLDAGSGHVAIELSGENRRRDRRLRIRFPLGASPKRVVADGHFGPVERTAGAVRSPARGRLETPAPTAPMQRYVSVAAGARGMTVLADGLPEYEARKDGALLVTILRAFGELSRADLRERPGHAGWPTPTPDAQCLGPYTARLGLFFHDQATLDVITPIERVAEEFHAPVMARMLRSALRFPEAAVGPTVVSDGLVFSALKPAEDGRGTVMRWYNPSGETRRGVLRVGRDAESAELCRLDETPLETLAPDPSGSLGFVAGPRAVVTIRFR